MDPGRLADLPPVRVDDHEIDRLEPLIGDGRRRGLQRRAGAGQHQRGGEDAELAHSSPATQIALRYDDYRPLGNRGKELAAGFPNWALSLQRRQRTNASHIQFFDPRPPPL